MKNYKLQILSTTLLEEYFKQVPEQLQEKFDAWKDAEISTDTFAFIPPCRQWLPVKLKVSKWK